VAEGVVVLAPHVVELVEALVGVVVVAECGVEFHVLRQQRGVGGLELALHLRRGVGAVDVVAGQEHESEADALLPGRHLTPELGLDAGRGPGIPDDREPDGPFLQRELDRVLTGRRDIDQRLQRFAAATADDAEDLRAARGGHRRHHYECQAFHGTALGM
jgi:hypothetical protein